MMLNQSLIRKGLPPIIMHKMDRSITEITEQWWPEIFDSTHGGCVTVEPEAGVKLEKLGEMFGVPLKLKLCSSDVIGHAYTIFVLRMGTDVRNALQYKDDIPKFLRDMPDEWREYVTAVAQQRKDDAKRMARELRVLRSDTVYPERFFANDEKAPPDMDAALDALWAIEDAKAK
jgi:hypothetical protein